ncbi:MAG: hypothetical protein Q8L29_00875, partial [archaeon]|nr:hypothetical protein [archaeon]
EEIFSKLIKDNSRAIYPAAREWRDLVFKVPIQISWLPSNPETGSGDLNNFCVSKINDDDGRYLWVDLSKPVKTRKVCLG